MDTVVIDTIQGIYMISEFVLGFCGYIFFQSVDRKIYNYHQWGIRKLFVMEKEFSSWKGWVNSV